MQVNQDLVFRLLRYFNSSVGNQANIAFASLEKKFQTTPADVALGGLRFLVGEVEGHKTSQSDFISAFTVGAMFALASGDEKIRKIIGSFCEGIESMPANISSLELHRAQKGLH